MKILVQDNDCHWYLIDESDSELFRKWVDFYESDTPIIINDSITREMFDREFEKCMINGPQSIRIKEYEIKIVP